VVEGERDGGVRGEGGVVEAEGGGEVGVAGAHVELVAEVTLGGIAGAAAASGLSFRFASGTAGVLLLRDRGGGRGGGGVRVAAPAGEGEVLGGAAVER